MEKLTTEQLDACACVGRQQAFAAIAGKCTAAQALCLKQIRESRTYEALGLTWEEFCQQHAGISRSRADALIQQFEEFGEDFFRLSEIVRVSPATYRQIESRVHDQCIEIDGHQVPLTPQNTPKIRWAIQSLRQELNATRKANESGYIAILTLFARLDAILEATHRLSNRFGVEGDAASLRGMINYAIEKFTKLKGDVEHNWPERLPKDPASAPAGGLEPITVTGVYYEDRVRRRSTRDVPNRR
ncbi:MAG TPA: hypothetical protein VE959_16675 [Bryobacteraceae bacterium]|nr:hypothetical protein [Bryobacteraceae bacterium]